MSPRRPLPIAARSLVLIAAVLTLLTLGAARADAPDAPAAPSVTGTTAAAPIPPAELGARADAQQPAPPPVLAAGQATLSAPLQALRGALDPAGLTVDSTSASEGEGQFRLTPTHLDKGATPLALPPGTVQLRGSAAVLERGPVTEILTASGDGLRQDFVVAQAPPGNGPLTLTLALDGATAAADPAGVALTLPGGRRLVYHRLHITDAAGQVLAGTLAAADAHTLTIRVADAAAHYPLTIDPTISDADWQVWNPGLPGANGTVNAMAYDSTGSRLYVGGSFTAIGTVLANRIAQWDGSAWSALGSGLNNQVYALAVSGTGLYVGGVFTSASGSPVNRIARWDGSTWSALGSGLNNTVNALAVSGTDLYVGGWFTTAGSSPASRIARWNGSTWSALGSGLSSAVNALAVSGTDLYVGGAFSTAGGSAANHIAQWNGSTWSALGSGLNNTVYALAVSGPDLYVGGWFTTAGGSVANHIAQWNGSTWSALGSGLDNWVNALAVSGTDLYVGGAFSTAGGSAANRIAKWNGSAWSALGSGLDDEVKTLAVSGTDLYVGGGFSTAGGSAANRIAQWNGSTWSALGSGLSSSVYALAVSGTDLYVGGWFTTAGGSAANNIAKWNGSTWSALGSGLYGTVYALAVSGTDLYVGGEFTTAGGSAANGIAQWNGSTWSALGALGGGLINGVYALAVSGPDLYVGGSFTTAGGSAANNIAKWNGSTWSALGSGLNNGVNALAVSGPDLYVGGWFTTAGGSAANNIAKWNGSAWSALGSGLDGTVTALAVSGTDLYVGGSFTTAGGSAANRIAQWNGSTWSALGSGLNDWVNALAVSGTDLYVGGHFLTAGGQFSPYAAYVHLPPCGSGLAYPTGQWQQFALPCTPSASPASIANVLGTSPTANLPLATYAGQWMLYGRNGTNSGNVALASNATLAPDAGYWFKSLTAPVDGKLQVIEGRTTPVESGVTGCQSVNGCAVIPVAGATAGARLIGNPFAYHVDWSKVRVRVNGIDLYTPSQAFAANLLSKQIWIWNGASYDTWDDASDPGNLQYFKSFFIKVLPGGVGKTIELLIPALPSGVPLSARPSGVAERLAAALRDWLIPGAAAAEPAAGWQVRLRVTNPATGAKTRALLGQRPAAEPGYDPADLSALAPFASPYLTLVIPQPGWGTNKGDYAADFRPADGVPDQWNLELRSNPAGAAVMLRWEGDPAVLARSRLTDRQTGRSSIPATRPLPTATRSPSPPRCGR